VRIFTKTVRRRGPSNSQRKIPCQLSAQFTVCDEDGLAGSGQDGFHMRAGVAFGAAIRAFVLDFTIEDSCDVAGDVGIGVLIDGNSGGGVRNVDVADAGFHIGFADSVFDFAGDIETACRNSV
jgi:hypothetical protein